MDEFEIMKAANKELQRLAHTTHRDRNHLGVFENSEMVTIWMDGMSAVTQPSSARCRNSSGGATLCLNSSTDGGHSRSRRWRRTREACAATARRRAWIDQPQSTPCCSAAIHQESPTRQTVTCCTHSLSTVHYKHTGLCVFQRPCHQTVCRTGRSSLIVESFSKP
jgi:hypothetical protein